MNATDQLAWMSFFSQWTQRIQTLHRLYLQQVGSKETAHLWTPTFDLLQSVFKEATSDYLPYPEEGALLSNFDPLDKRFRGDLWQTHPFYLWLHQCYLILCSQIERRLSSIKNLDPSTKKKLHFCTKQLLDALSPGHFVMTNPEVLQITLQTQGQNIIQGLDHFIEDIARTEGQFQISMTDLNAFTLGKNIATTKGRVIYQNTLMQLIQYEPQTKHVYKEPLLIIPPWINKYYVLDLNKEQSLVNWLVQKGYTVFMISWVNPDAHYAETQFEDYLLEGPLAALDVIFKIAGIVQIHAVGYCIGGTLLACLLSYLAYYGQSQKVLSGTYLTTLLDFSEPGDLSVFIDEQQINSLEKLMEKQGFLDGKTLGHLFNSLRANDLIWSYYIKHYLQGNVPLPMDVLFWNADSTNLPKAMHRFYLRNMYLENRLIQPGGIQLAGVPIDLKSVQIPVYFLSTEQDHIAPWKSTYAGMHLHSGPSTFVLGGSGHVLGVINAPGKNKYHFYTNKRKYRKPETFIKNAQRHLGSWWEHWEAWLRSQSGGQTVCQRKVKQGIGSAPGTYTENNYKKQ